VYDGNPYALNPTFSDQKREYFLFFL